MDAKIRELVARYDIGDTSLFFIRNRNERRVIEAIPRILGEDPGFIPNTIDLQDIYALALNSLPPRYVQQGSIVLREPVRQDEIEDAVRSAVAQVRARPNYPQE
ncbi:late competence development ComFB family protein [Desulfocurvus sp.]|jgi:hypothetical protein|uniref:late competence development ComFB family protein n=1 Tax=Desulfocurvus sp. TaxID=2871698 RepID=UPI0025BA4178|nr:late competence development ComFB family protein [Desulfocurvus sp.]MCK9240730.1 late competence development ComFB family protein [Desulfocurvus sp.]